jgi:hypothetical protein
VSNGYQLNTSAEDGSHLSGRERTLKPVRRVVTGLNAEGRSTVVSDQICPFTFAFPGIPDFGATDIWRTRVPADNTDLTEPCFVPFGVQPSEGGIVFRITQLPPDALFLEGFNRDVAFSAMPGMPHNDGGESSGNQTMHRTSTVNMTVVVSGEIYALLEDCEVKLNAGDTLIQRGTVHGWSNRTSENCIIALVLVDAREIEIQAETRQ